MPLPVTLRTPRRDITGARGTGWRAGAGGRSSGLAWLARRGLPARTLGRFTSEHVAWFAIGVLVGALQRQGSFFRHLSRHADHILRRCGRLAAVPAPPRQTQTHLRVVAMDHKNFPMGSKVFHKFFSADFSLAIRIHVRYAR
jgi:hypothetical protein